MGLSKKFQRELLGKATAMISHEIADKGIVVDGTLRRIKRSKNDNDGESWTEIIDDAQHSINTIKRLSYNLYKFTEQQPLELDAFDLRILKPKIYQITGAREANVLINLGVDLIVTATQFVIVLIIDELIKEVVELKAPYSAIISADQVNSDYVHLTINCKTFKPSINALQRASDMAVQIGGSITNEDNNESGQTITIKLQSSVE